jgi:hypothetical protein
MLTREGNISSVVKLASKQERNKLTKIIN